MENNEQLDAIRELLEQGDTAGAMNGMLDMICHLSQMVDEMSNELEVIYACLDDEDEDDFYFGEDCDTYLYPCPGCDCLLQVDAEALEEENVKLKCPECGAVLDI